MATLDIVALRSFVAVAAFSGVRQAGEALHLSRSAVSGHIRKLERELGRRLVAPHGRGIGLTSDGEELVVRAREILQQHDDAVRALAPNDSDELLVAATEHAAEFLMPAVVSLLDSHFPGRRIRLRLTRSEHVRELVHDERADIALMLTRPARKSVEVATLPLRWFGTDDAPTDRIVLFDPPCALRHQALASLRDREHRIVKECSDLTTVLTTARNGVGITPLPLMGPPPDGLRPTLCLPAIPDVTLHATTSGRVDAATSSALVTAIRSKLGSDRSGT
ncbi:LysR family transcriptional regulator [Saccharopolyspora sp. NFXS83]|uniref:LysR family transcriptional regulator n=1 Tax=Saccharopolyspora sp. NFXS83 TaxID=2993560 RepID=UPI00224AE8E1|nr:LysR family transcriptional regulator [Saccharopolyspora sp. NFXS83]MCX2731077.1 LysR family transcriptional regulator [Saccharopolyspora sp. NFXS83]